MGRSSDAHIEMLENMSDEERQKYEEQELMSDPEAQWSMMINERREKGMVVHDHEMWVGVESDKKDAMSESDFKAFQKRIKKLKVKWRNNLGGRWRRSSCGAAAAAARPRRRYGRPWRGRGSCSG